MSGEVVLHRLEVIPKSELKREMSLEKLWDLYVGLKGKLARQTLVEYRITSNGLIPYLKRHGITHNSVVNLQAFFKNSGENGAEISNNWANKKMTQTRGFLKFLHTMRYVGEDLSGLVYSLPPDAAASPEILTEDEYERIKIYCGNKDSYNAHKWLVILGYRTGMSLVDCCYLRWKDVTLNENGPSYIDIHRTKTQRLGEKALCQIPIIPGTDVHEWLLNLKKVEHLNYKRFDGITDYVHQDCPGLYECTWSTLRRDFIQIFTACKISRKKTFKTLRASFCSNLVNSGTQLALVMKMTGHQNVKTLMRYLKADRMALQDGLDKAFKHSAETTGVYTDGAAGLITLK